MFTSLYIIYGKKRHGFTAYPLFDLLLRYINGGSGCFVLAVVPVLDGSIKKCSAIFSKMPKANHIKIVIFRKHFS